MNGNGMDGRRTNMEGERALAFRRITKIRNHRREIEQDEAEESNQNLCYRGKGGEKRELRLRD
jgi:hypothetical protein